MEILTLLKANIRHKKGSFVSVILLTLIIAMSVTTILSIKESTFKGVDKAHEICGTPDITALFRGDMLTDELLEKIKNNDKVERAYTENSILIEKAVMGKEEYGNPMFFMRANEDTKLLKVDLSGVAENTPKLKKGEVYVPQGLLTNLRGKVGQKISFSTLAGEYEFTVKGIWLEPTIGSSMIGWKKICISDEDFSEITSAVSKVEAEDKHGLGKILTIYKADNCTLTNGQLRRQLNIETGVTDMSIGSVTKDMSIHYTELFPEIISSILIVFVVFLLVIVLIVTVHSISVEIETNYVTFGVLKAQGFGKNKIRLLFLGQYLLAEVIGAAAGIVLSIPLIKLTSNIFVTVTAIPAAISVPIGIIALIIAAMFVLSAVSVFIITVKLNKISPVRAIAGAKKEVYFDSRLNAPISRRSLSASLALRQFTSAKRRYIATLVIIAILVFFMMTITILANTLNSKTAMEAMGAIVSEINVNPKSEFSDDDYEKIEKEIEKFSAIKKAFYTTGSYFSFDGEEMMCTVCKDPSVLPVLKGRTSEYDNEIVVSPILLDEFDLNIGDEVTVGWKGKKEKYLISGTVQLMNDTGRSFVMSYSAAQKIGYEERLWGCYVLENGDDQKLNEKIASSLNEKFGDIIEAEAAGEIIDDSTKAAVQAMQMIIYVFSVLFSLVVVHMVCSKAFIQERTDIGIYKAEGFTSKKLRIQFAVRFLIVAVLGSALGAALNVLFAGRLLSTLLYSLGITHFLVDFTPFTFIAPITLICVCFFVFAYFVSRKIKSVAVRELVVE